jgi:pimeloyl-ACP methyl ester carboxylesterase
MSAPTTEQVRLSDSAPALFDDDPLLAPLTGRAAHGALRLPDGRALAWGEHGSTRGLPVVLLPDTGSSRLAPTWLLHGSTLPHAARLLALDRPGVGLSDPMPDGGPEQPAEDLRRLVETLAVGRVAVVAIGRSVADAALFAARYPALVTSLTAVSPRLPEAEGGRRRGLRARAGRPATGLLPAFLAAAGRNPDLTALRTWVRIAHRVDPELRAGLQDRWQVAEFRRAVAADAALGTAGTGGTGGTAGRRGSAGVPSSSVRRGDDVPSWSQTAAHVRVPVHVWQGSTEPGSTLQEVRGLLEARPNWRLTVVPGASAALGPWDRVLSEAAASFRPVAAA